MPHTKHSLLHFLAGLGIAATTVDHPPLYTVEESRQLRGQIAGAHAKNLFVKDKKSRLFVVATLEDAALDLKTLHEAIGAQGRVSFGAADLLEQVWGVRPGAVTPFGAINDTDNRVTVVLDAALMAQPLLNFHPLVNTSTTSIAARDLVAFLEAAGHRPLIVPLPRQSGEGGAQPL